MPPIPPVSRLLLPALLAAAPFAAARAQPVVIGGNHLSGTPACGGEDAVVRGNGNALTFRDQCRSLLLEGNDNRISVRLPPGASLVVRGNGNRVRYGAAGGDARVQAAGLDNSVQAEDGAPVPAAPPRPDGAALVLREENARRDLDCAGRDVLVEGNGDRYTLRGGCRSLRVRGEGLSIRAQMRPGAPIAVQGNGDSVGWSVTGGGADPVVSVDGEGSQVEPVAAPLSAAPPVMPAPAAPLAAPPAILSRELPVAAPVGPPPLPRPAFPAATLRPAPPSPVLASLPPRPRPSAAGPLVLRGDHEARDVDCAGRDVRVDGDFGLYVLRGGCRSVSVKGDSDKLQAEIAPGARIEVKGAGTAFAYVLMGGDEPPALSVQGQGSRAWAMPRLGEPGPEADPPPVPPRGSTGEHAHPVPGGTPSPE